MLTRGEKRWLKKRKEWSVCSYCSNIPQTMCLYGERPHFCALLDVDHKDAAEFEGRVAAKLATILDRTLRSRDYTLHADCTRVCPAATDCTKSNRLGFDCAPYLIKWAMIAVEDEMDRQNLSTKTD